MKNTPGAEIFELVERIDPAAGGKIEAAAIGPGDVDIHLLPRHEADGMEFIWPVKNPPREALEGYAEKIRKQLT